jgi:hypothetical protein
MFWPRKIRQVYGFGTVRMMGDFVKKATSGEKKQEEMRKRLENSLPWSLSRWLRKKLRKRR